MGETIKNTETKVKKDCSMNEKDIINDILISYKHLVSSYAIALNEASNKDIYKLFFESFKNISGMQAKIFECAFQNGWYQLETADQTKIDKAYDKYSKMEKELSTDN